MSETETPNWLPSSLPDILGANGLIAVAAAMQAQTATAHFSGAQTTFSISVTYPYGLAVDASGNIYVADNFSGGVSIVSPQGSSGLGVSGLNWPLWDRG